MGWDGGGWGGGGGEQKERADTYERGKVPVLAAKRMDLGWMRTGGACAGSYF